MKVYYPHKQYCQYIVTEFSLKELWKRMEVIDLLNFLRNVIFLKRNVNIFAIVKIMPDIDFD